MMLDLLLARAALHADAESSVFYARRNGIDWQALVPQAGIPLLTHVSFESGRHFNFGGNVPAAVIEAYGRDETEALDLVAWSIERPDKFATFYGRAIMLGIRAVFDPATYALETPLRVYRTPLEWLQARCEGCVMLDPFRAGRLLLDAPGLIAAQDESHAAEIGGALMMSLRLERIMVPARGKPSCT